MKSYIELWLAILVGLSFITMAFPESKPDRSYITYYPRQTTTECPPEYTSTRSAVVRYLKGDHTAVGGVDFNELKEELALESLSARDFVALNGASHASICKALSEEYERLMAKRVQLFDGVQPEYLFDLTFFEAKGFYFVVAGGGVIIQNDPMDPQREKVHFGYPGPFVQAYDAALQPVISREQRSMIENGEITPNFE